MIIVISSSLRSDSNSRILAQAALKALEAEGHEAKILDLREHPLPLCDGDAVYNDPKVRRINALLNEAEAFIIATPIYNFDATAAIKNLIELTGDAWESKVVSFLCAAAAMSSYMSIMSLANSLMLDFRSVIVPRFVYATGSAIANGSIIDAKIQDRVDELARFTAKLGSALKAA
jgi:FMN reductase